MDLNHAKILHTTYSYGLQATTGHKLLSKTSGMPDSDSSEGRTLNINLSHFNIPGWHRTTHRGQPMCLPIGHVVLWV